MADTKGDAREKVQIKTFVKWCNNHLAREWGKGVEVKDILGDWTNGILLMKLAVALYKENDKHPEQAISMPELKANETKDNLSRIQMVANCGKALALLKKAGVKLTISAENLVDKEKIQILGAIWMVILDYASRGFGGSPAEVKKALLEWVNKKTEGYKEVNPPGVKNFTTNWRSGLAWLALIDRHRPGMIDYNSCVGKSNAENLELAFETGLKLGIPRLLDVEDVDVADPDEKSILTYVMEYFLAFAGDALKEVAAKQAANWLKFIRELKERQNDYERRARILIDWTKSTIGGWSTYNFGTTQAEASDAFNKLRSFVGQDKPVREMEKMDLESLFAEIQTTLLVNNLRAYAPPADITPDGIGNAFHEVAAAQNSHSNAVRAAKFKFIEKKKDTAQDDMKAQIEVSFKNYDKNNNSVLNKAEFLAGCMEMGVVLKTQEQKDALFDELADASSQTISLQSYTKWMLSRMVVSMDNADAVKQTFKTLADGRKGLSAADIGTQPLSDEDRVFIKSEMTADSNGQFDYEAFVDKLMA